MNEVASFPRHSEGEKQAGGKERGYFLKLLLEDKWKWRLHLFVTTSKGAVSGLVCRGVMLIWDQCDGVSVGFVNVFRCDHFGGDLGNWHIACDDRFTAKDCFCEKKKRGHSTLADISG